jgi:hypothetical protein
MVLRLLDERGAVLDLLVRSLVEVGVVAVRPTDDAT